MGCESSDVVRFDLGPLKQGQPNLKVLITRLLLVLEVCNVKPTYRKSWAENLLMSDLTLSPTFKVKQGIVFKHATEKLFLKDSGGPEKDL